MHRVKKNFHPHAVREIGSPEKDTQFKGLENIERK